MENGFFEIGSFPDILSKKLVLLEAKFGSSEDFCEVSKFHTGEVLFCCKSIRRP